MLKRILSCILITVMLCAVLVSCGEKKEEPEPDVPALRDYGVEHEPEFGGIYITATIDYFNSLG
ncbi:MAG: hypothetical protein J6Z24_03745, partial [Oscillospiraceae bacterium]|nr:hypothetical protein [Oscillospiraceae bacterium]